MKFRICLWLLLLASVRLMAQQDSLPADTAFAAPPRTTPPPFVFRPTVGLGTGMFSYFGDLYTQHFISPQVSRVAYELNLSQPINPSLRLGFYALFGKLGANERLINRNTNFESEIRVGGLHLEYNFAHLLHDSTLILPWITAGFESFEFLSKTDLFDANSNRYFYWSDGSIRNIDENDPNAASATFLKRDYVYESDIREQNLDGFGKYPERSWAVPVGAGVLFKLTPQWEAKVGATMHFTFTDFIDGVTNESVGVRKGDAKGDHFMMTSVTLRYNLQGPKKKLDSLGRDFYQDVDYYALDKMDYDQDGVIDYKDSCGNTPPGVAVDIHGCPIDTDKDLVPDYRDDELASALGALVDERGVTMSDSAILRQYEMYWDSTGKFAKTVILRSGGTPYTGPITERKTYTVSLGQYKSGLPNDLMTKFLSIEDIGSKTLKDSSTIYTVGKYDDLRAAEKRKRILLQQGITVATVVYETPDGTFKEVNVFTNTGDPLATNNTNSNSNSNTNSNTNSNSNTNTNANTNSNSNTNSNTNANSNTNTNANSNTNSNSNSNTNANTNSNSNTNSNTNANTNANSNTNSNASTDQMPTGDKLVFRVQLGAFRNRLSKGVFADIPDLIEIKGDDGLYRYLTGSFATFDDAAGHKINTLVKGYKGAFIVAYKNGKRVALTDAGAVIVKSTPLTPDSASATNAVSKSLVNFKVQIGVFKETPPEDFNTRLQSVSGVEKTTMPSGAIRYSVGNTNNYEEITNLKRSMRDKGFADAFVLAFFKGEPISVQEALELLK